MMSTRLLLILCLTQHVFAQKSTDVDCLVVNLEYVHCSWNKPRTPEVNYTFYSGFSGKKITECATYLTENNINTGCNQPYGNKVNRFNTYHTRLLHDGKSFEAKHDLRKKVMLNPPANLTVKNESDSNLWFYWNQTASGCEESEVRYRTNNNNWETSKVSPGKQSYCINLPSRNAKYELQVRSRIEANCGESLFWSDWSEPVVWGSNNSTDTNQPKGSMFVWNQMLYVVGVVVFIILVVMMLQNERIRILIVPVVPKPSLSPHEDWLQLSKGLSETNYNERACPVREYCQVSQSDSESSGSSDFSVTTDQTDCSVSIPVDEPDPSTPDSSSTTAGVVSSDEARPVSV